MKYSVRVVTIVLMLMVSLFSLQASAKSGTRAKPEMHNVFVHGNDRIPLRREVISYLEDGNIVVGTILSLHFTLNKPAKEVWPIFQNFNLWQNQSGYYYSGDFGDSEGGLGYLMFSSRPGASFDRSQAFIYQQVIPEHSITAYAPAFESVDEKGVLRGYKHIGKHSLMLTDIKGKTVVTAVFQHNNIFGPDNHDKAKAYLASTVKAEQEKERKNIKDKWETSFEPKLRALVEGKQ